MYELVFLIAFFPLSGESISTIMPTKEICAEVAKKRHYQSKALQMCVTVPISEELKDALIHA